MSRARWPVRPDLGRRACLGGGFLVAATLIVVTRARTAPSAQTARIPAKLPKADAGYQYAPRGEQRCGLCASFIPGDAAEGPGACKLVEGPIPQAGWCQLFAAR